MRKKLVIGLFVAVSLAWGASLACADDSLFCAVCAAWGPDSPLYQFFGCAQSCGNGGAGGS